MVMTTAKWGARENALLMDEECHLVLATIQGTMSHFKTRGALEGRIWLPMALP